MKRILIVDDNDRIRWVMRALLAILPGWMVCGEAADGEEAVRQANRLLPDLIVMDLVMPRMNGLDATRKILARNPRMKVVIFSTRDTPETVQAAKDSGARGYVTKSGGANSLIKAVRTIFQGRTFFPAEPRGAH